MKLTWIGHACFKVEGSGEILVIDPYADGSVPGLQPVREEAHRVLCSHGHGDHAGRETVTLLPQGQAALQVDVLHTFHDDARGTLRGPNDVFIISDGRHRIAHMGDIGCQLTEAQLEALQNLDALLIPVGGFFTVDGVQAAAMVKALAPRIVVPMHFRDDEQGFGFDKIGTDRDFVREMGSALPLGASTLDTEEAFGQQVVILRPRNCAG